jgi:hypothetical protein
LSLSIIGQLATLLIHFSLRGGGGSFPGGRYFLNVSVRESCLAGFFPSFMAIKQV